MTSPLCNTCNELCQPKELAPWDYDDHRVYTRESTERDYLPEKGASQGCFLCFRLLLQMSEEDKEMLRQHRAEDQNLPPPKRTYETYLNFQTGRLLPYGIHIAHRATNSSWNVNDKDRRFVSLSLTEDEGAYSPETMVASSTDSHETMVVINEWMRMCNGSHVCFKPEKTEGSALPTRVLCVSSDETENIYLVEFKSGLGRYATLSHCWGEHKPLQLLESNLIQFQTRGIPILELPKTFQDAVKVTRSLSIDYLWIDSLCIVQDSTKDWLKESALMYRVYTNATMNIAAGSAVDCREGLFATRDPRIIKPCYIDVDVPTKDNNHTRRRLVVIEDWLWISNVNMSPLNQRAWVYQEQLLSRRTIHFAESQVFWECREKMACEEFPTGFPTRNFAPSSSKAISNPLIRHSSQAQLAQISAPVHTRSVSATWQQIVVNYSEKTLTFGSDKLIAISALARLCAPLIHGDSQYLAGLWREDIISHLLWSGIHRGQRSRQKEYRAPTWSWASIDGAIKYDKFIPNSFRANVPEDFMIKEVEIELGSLDPFGSVQGGKIRALCRLTWARCYTIHNHRVMPQYRLVVGKGAAISEKLGGDSLNRLHEVILKDVTFENDSALVGNWDNIFFVPMAYERAYGKEECNGLILEALPGQRGVFQRFGYSVYRTAEPYYKPKLEQMLRDFDEDAEQFGFDIFTKHNGENMYFITIV